MRSIAADMVNRVDPQELMSALALAFQDVSSGKAVMPTRTSIAVREEDARLLVMPAYVPSAAALATKLVALYPRNPARGLPFVVGIVVLFDVSTGEPIATIDGAAVTALRTGYASAVAANALARADARTLAIVGAGVQARSHAIAMSKVRQLTHIRISSRTRSRADELADDLRTDLDVEVTVTDDIEAAVRGADIVVTATTSMSPLLTASMVDAGSHVCAVGAFGPDMRELADDLVAAAAILAVDTRAGCLAEAEDLKSPIGKGLVATDAVTEMGEILLGSKAGRSSADQISIYKSVGMAALDVAAARVIYDQAG